MTPPAELDDRAARRLPGDCAVGECPRGQRPNERLDRQQPRIARASVEEARAFWVDLGLRGEGGAPDTLGPFYLQGMQKNKPAG